MDDDRAMKGETMRRAALASAISGAFGGLCLVACSDDSTPSGAAGSAGSVSAGSGGSVTAGAGGGSAGTGGSSAGSGGTSNAGAGGTSNAGAGGTSNAGAGGAAAGTGGSAGGAAGAGGSPTPCTDPTEIPAFSDQPLHLKKSCSPYHVSTASLLVSPDITIEAGVTVAFAPGASLRAALSAVGTAAAPIRFVPDKTGAPKGSWGGVWLAEAVGGGGKIELRNVVIEGAGAAGDATMAPGAALHVAAAATLDTVSIDGSKGYGLALTAPLDAGSKGITFTGIDDHLVALPIDLVPTLPAITSGSANSKATIFVETGPSVTGTWVSQPVPFFLADDATVGDGATGESTTLTIQKNTLLFAAGAGLTVGAADGQTGTGDLIANDVTFDAVDPTKPWDGLTIVGRYSAATSITGGSIAHGFGATPFSTSIPMTTPTAFNLHYAALFVGESTATQSWAKVSGVTIHDVSPVPPIPAMSNDVAKPTCIVVRGIPCDKPAPHYEQMSNTLTCSVPVLDYDGCVGP